MVLCGEICHIFFIVYLIFVLFVLFIYCKLLYSLLFCFLSTKKKTFLTRLIKLYRSITYCLSKRSHWSLLALVNRYDSLIPFYQFVWKIVIFQCDETNQHIRAFWIKLPLLAKSSHILFWLLSVPSQFWQHLLKLQYLASLKSCLCGSIYYNTSNY